MIERNTDLAEPYYSRGMALLTLEEWEKAKSDLTTAIGLQENIVIENFSENYDNIADFEQKHHVTLPEDIAAMLTPPNRSCVTENTAFRNFPPKHVIINAS